MAAFTYTPLPDSSPASSRRSSYTGGSAVPRRSLSRLAIICGWAVALGYFSFTAWSDATLELLASLPPQGEDYDRLYREFTPRRARTPAGSVVKTPMYGDECLESWLAGGRVCDELRAAADVELDAVISWVNGSDPLWHEQYAYYSEVSRIPKGWGPAPIRHYREKDELRHALRALSVNMPGRLRKIHIILGDWARSDARSLEEIEATTAGEDAAQGERVGQVPYWLKQDILGVESEDGLTIEVHHHSELFVDRTLNEDDVEGAKAYEERALPTFNSFAIESQLTNIPGLAPHWIYLNDDFFVSQPHSRSDWYTPAYGPLLRIESPTGPFGTVDYATSHPPAACTHERSALLRSNWLMSQRFGRRRRVPLSHIPKVQSQALLQESAEIWKEDFAVSSTRRFREIEEGETEESKIGDLHAVWLAAILLVERSREAMLWTWVVAKMGGLDGIWADTERDALAALLELDLSGPVAEAHAARVPLLDHEARSTVAHPHMKSKLAEMGLAEPLVSNVTFSSLDGPEPGRGAHSTSCKVDMALCFGAFWTASTPAPAADVFTRLAFAEPACGDCILSALVRASGAKGLAAVLPAPAPGRATGRKLADDVTPHMPLTKRWEGTDFALQALVGPDAAGVDLRAWCLRLLARYQYSLGEQTHLFAQVFFPDDIFTIQASLAERPVSTVVLNDDLEGTAVQQQQASANIRAVLDEAWPSPAWWERDAVPRSLPGAEAAAAAAVEASTPVGA